VQHLRGDQPRVKISEQAASLRHRPAKRIDLDGLKQMLRPVREDNDHEQSQRELVLWAVDALEQRELVHGACVGMGRVQGALVFGRLTTPSIV
jgi:hypothetical protein